MNLFIPKVLTNRNLDLHVESKPFYFRGNSLASSSLHYHGYDEIAGFGLAIHIRLAKITH